MTTEDYIRFASALVLVLALMGILSIIVRKLNNGTGGFLAKSDRLSVIEQKMIDGKNKMVLIRRDTVEHLVILSPNGETIVETGIKSPKIVKSPKNKKDIPLEI
ncbi:MAG: hypothetical protein COB76_00885 [Alphaproteobacteria bacterium]|nr:MAG: hypothetical protein COB76_00885 [Alphaproteobacteria bacterium]